VDLRHRIVIAQHRPWRRFALVAAGAAALACGAFALYRYARATTVSDFAHAQLERDQLRAESRELSQKLRAALNENQRLHDQLAYLNRSQQIEGSACDTVKRSLSALQSENADLREQLAFYRGIVSPSESQAGVRVFEFKVHKLAQANAYRYDLVLIQSVRRDKRTDGTAEISIEGYRGGQKQMLKLADLLADHNRNLVFSFKYFQEFSGTFRLPEGFKPQRAQISLTADGASKIDDDYDWAKIVQESTQS
jgi:hypothetical protein